MKVNLEDGNPPKNLYYFEESFSLLFYLDGQTPMLQEASDLAPAVQLLRFSGAGARRARRRARRPASR